MSARSQVCACGGSEKRKAPAVLPRWASFETTWECVRGLVSGARFDDKVLTIAAV
ncbi:hypothetical protein M2361_000784 [Achromobacter sp. JUb104]|nr:hypothetical protein [Achromobacter sp. JUb104]